MALIQANELSLAFGSAPVLDGVSLAIEEGERVCLVGRNGEGKSCLMRLLSGDQESDGGELHFAPHARVAYLPQEVPSDLEGTAADVVLQGLGEIGALLAEYEALTTAVGESADAKTLDRLQRVQDQIGEAEAWDMQRVAEGLLRGLNLPPDAPFASLSGGMKRQVLFASALVRRPNLLILDEPTNHLDIEAITRLEKFLQDFDGAVLFVTHDRMFVRRLATRILDLDRGKLMSWPGNYDLYLQRKEAWLDAEEAEWKREDKKLAKEEVWIRQGIKARRTRNEGRVRALKKLREERKERRDRVGKARISLHDAARSGKRIFTTEDLGFSWPDQTIVQGLTVDIQRGDRIGFIGPNGCGKTTLVRLLLGQLEPTSGRVSRGTKLKVVYFDQLRSELEDERTVQENLADGDDTVIINGEQRHTIGYLSDFLFPPERARSPVKVLSGGERNRLLLAKMFIQEANLLVMDEPTNDLDTETLELLETLLLGYKGTLLLVSHDREFINNVVTSTLVFDEDGTVRSYAGGYDDWLMQRVKPSPKAPVKAEQSAGHAQTAPKKKTQKLSYMDARALGALPKEIEALEAEQAEIHLRIADPAFYQLPDAETAPVHARIAQIEAALLLKYERWETLEALQSGE
jgi:ATP-binding cassette subfamily F protein uup